MVFERRVGGSTSSERIASADRQRGTLYKERSVLARRLEQTVTESDAERAANPLLRAAIGLEHSFAVFTTTKGRTIATVAGSIGAAVAPVVIPMSDGWARGLGVGLGVIGGGAVGEKWKPLNRIAAKQERQRASKVYAKLRETDNEISSHGIARAIPHTGETLTVVPMGETNDWIRLKKADLVFTADPENTTLPRDPRPRIVRTIFERKFERRKKEIGGEENIAPKEMRAYEVLTRAEVVNEFAHAQIEIHRERASMTHIVGESIRRIGNIAVPAAALAGFADVVSQFLDSHFSGIAGVADDIPTWIAIGVSALATTVAKRLNTDENPSTGHAAVERKWAQKQHQHAMLRATAAPDNRHMSHLANVIQTRR